MIIKVCGITNREDALGAVAAGADALGFNFWPKSPRYLSSTETARRLVAELPPDVLKVGVFVDLAADRIEEIMRVVRLHVAQVHGSQDRPLQVRHWTAYSAATPHLADVLKNSSAEAALIDTPAGELRGGTGRTFDWSMARGLPGRIVLAGGLGPDNVAAAIQTVRPWGVDACSRLESAPGRKDLAKVRAFVEAVRATS